MSLIANIFMQRASSTSIYTPYQTASSSCYGISQTSAGPLLRRRKMRLGTGSISTQGEWFKRTLGVQAALDLLIYHDTSMLI